MILATWWIPTNLFKNIFLMFICFWETETQSVSRRGSEREGDTESEAGSRLWAVSAEPDAGLELTEREIVTWAEVGRLTDWATQAPQCAPFQGEGCVIHLISWTLVEKSYLDTALLVRMVVILLKQPLLVTDLLIHRLVLFYSIGKTLRLSSSLFT